MTSSSALYASMRRYAEPPYVGIPRCASRGCIRGLKIVRIHVQSVGELAKGVWQGSLSASLVHPDLVVVNAS